MELPKGEITDDPKILRGYALDLEKENARLRAEAKRMEECAFAWKAEVERLEGLILGTVRKGEGRSVFLSPSELMAEAKRIRGEK